MRRHFIPIVIFFSLIAGIIVFLLNSSWFLLDSVPHTIAPYIKPFQLQSLRIGKQSYQVPGTLVLNDVRFSLKQKFTQINFAIDKLVIYDFMDLAKKPRKVRVDVSGMNMDGRDIKLEKMNLKLLLLTTEDTVNKVEGLFGANKIVFEPYHTELTQGRIHADSKKVELLDITGKAYGGDIKGQILIDRGEMHSYIVWGELFGVKPDQLKEINESIFSGMNGQLTGSFRMKNDGKIIQFLTAELSLDKGGEINSRLIEKTFSQSASLNKAGPIETIIQGRERLSFDQGHFYLQNSGQTIVMVGAELKNTQEDLNIRALHEVATPRGIDEFLLKDIRNDIFSKGE